MTTLAPKEPKIEYVECTDFTPGLNTLDDPIDIDKGATPYVLNMDIVRKGKLLARFGYEKTSEIADVVMRGIQPYYRTYDDNSAVDQTGAGGGNTYAVPLVISELAVNKKTFTPSSIAKGRIFRIAVLVVAKGTGDWTLTLHDAANNVLGSKVILNANLTNGTFNYFTVPYTWTSGVLHFHVTSTVNDGTLNVGTANDLSTVDFQEVYRTSGDYLVLHASNGNSYYVTAANNTPTLIGQWGSDQGKTVRGVTYNNFAAFSDGQLNNVIRKWNASSLQDVEGNPPQTSIFGVFQKCFFAAGDPNAPSTVYYSDPDTFANLSTNFINITLGDGWDLTAFVANNDALQTYKTDTIHAINFSFDNSYNLTVPQQQPIVNTQGGVWATDSLQAVYGYSYYMSIKGFETYGPSPERIIADRPLPLSLEIEPTFKMINLQYTDGIKSAFFDNKYLCAVPLGASQIATNVFVYNENIKRRYGRDNWTVYDDIPASGFAKFRNSKKIDELYFVSGSEGKLFKFNNTFSDAGFGYKKVWTSKTFKFGSRSHFKYIDFEGIMTRNEVITIGVFTDTQTATDQITSANLITAGFAGAYVGDSYVGNSYIGGGFTGSTTPMYKFKKRFYFPQNVDEGFQMYFQLSSSLNNAGWGLNRYVLAYWQLPEEPTYSYAT